MANAAEIEAGRAGAGRYRGPAQALHWLTALLILSTIPAGVIMVEEGTSRPVQDALYLWHKNVGVVIFLLVVARLIYRAFHPAPPLPGRVPPLQRRIAYATHWLLYLLVLVMTISGYIRVKAGGFPIEMLDALGLPSLVPRSDDLAETAQNVHLTARYAIVVLVLLHIGAALYHLLVRKDGVFQRMLPGRR
ncbi:cytochrome b [Pseudoroseicyclus tamaricis]|uniref:Cytochrome b n=1 Tax=Pseudoroseicyclus tamaricis TaxID=2705421 RepID=A0A6B2JSJ6_9RHOB|nr:cytochrome b [Pseudoroseicyclus tamaricis]NDV01198.1 cytochrome b [Pseudoroseicyclus tamaricis]